MKIFYYRRKKAFCDTMELKSLQEYCCERETEFDFHTSGECYEMDFSAVVGLFAIFRH